MQALGKFGPSVLGEIPIKRAVPSRLPAQPWLGTSMTSVRDSSLALSLRHDPEIGDDCEGKMTTDLATEKQIADCSHPVLGRLVDMVSKDPFFKVRFVA